MTKTDPAEVARYRVTGMDCSACAAKIEATARSVAGVRDAKVSIASQEMTLRTEDETAPLPEVERLIAGLGYRLARINVDEGDKIPDLSHVTPAYKRAFWIVVLLNAGYGVVEGVGGFLAGSQSVKADALDFIGDGVVSFLV
jgi:copper chaperone CopZ